MKKPNVIGFFLALVYGCADNKYFSSRNDWMFLNGSDPVITEPQVLFLPALQEFGPAVFSVKCAVEGYRQLLSFCDGIGFFPTIFSFDHILINKSQVADNRLKMQDTEESVLFNNAPCGYHTVDDRGFVVSVNDTLLRWLGYDRSEMVGRMKFSDVVEAEFAIDERIAALEKYDDAVEIFLIKKSGEKLPVLLALVPSASLTVGSKTRMFSTIDNSRCHEATERIKTLDQELEAFSYSISHDLRAPLRSIDGYSKILQEDYASALDEEGRRVLNVVMNNARRMGKLIDDLLDFARLGRKALHPAQLNMTSVVKTIVQECLTQVPGRTIHVNVSELLPARGDADMIRQVWTNLLDNAMKFTGKRDVAVINIRSYPIGDREICYEVTDNGVGFDMQYAPKLFGVFQRLHKIQDFGGTGVGLAIVKRIVSRHGGHVWTEAFLDRGATFYFTLPIDDENT